MLEYVFGSVGCELFAHIDVPNLFKSGVFREKDGILALFDSTLLLFRVGKIKK